ncbi:MAG: sigma 54-interacting transcriptional regulator, partial [Planctomycetota bacterium]
MVGSDPMLQAYAGLLRRSLGASIVSLFVPTPGGSFPRPLLLHDGELPALPELADAETADAFCRQAALQPAPWQPIASGADHGWLVRLPSLEELLGIGSVTAVTAPRQGRRRRRGDRRADADAPDCTPWLGIRLEPGNELDRSFRDAMAVVASIGADEDRTRETWTGLLPVAGALAWHNQQISLLMREPVSGLPGRSVLQMVLRDALLQARECGGSAALLLINPDEFDFVNERFGREAGDAVVREIAERLTATLRRTDFVCRYGGAVFGVALSDAKETDVGTLSNKLRAALQLGGYLDGSVRLSFSFGAASYAPAPSEDPEEAMLGLLRRTDRALNGAKLAGGGRTTVCAEGRELEEVGQFDRLCGIFTANQAKDYRNMLLLWDTVRAVTSSDDVTRLMDTVLNRLVATFHSDRAALFERLAKGHRLVHGVTRGSGATDRCEISCSAADLEALLDRARALGRAVENDLTGGEPSHARLACAVPLTTGEHHVGALVLEGDQDALALDAADRILLEALGGQLAIALDRARLVQQERRRLERESRQLRQELNELRQVLDDAKLVHRSRAMEAVLAVAQRVAPTEATVLVCGESGTGKELIAHTIHGLSRRRDKPLVVVDCSAIATSLIDSELFGHERGAYTGAETRTAGRLAEADGGTILLDEIGELPLEVQGKLLRFVQEKQFTTVGGSRPRRVDVRLVAATNRDLAAEVAAGRFREDLYFRLRVVQLTLPPLRKRPDDVLLLARHFVERVATEHGKDGRRLSREAETALVNHDWP